MLHVGVEQLLRHSRLCFACEASVAINTTRSAIAPKVAGHLFDQGVGYAATFYFLAAWGFISAVVLIFTRRPEATATDGPVTAEA